MPVSTRISVNLLSRNIPGSVSFYRALTGFDVVEQNDWMIAIAAGPDAPFQLVFVDWVSQFVPKAARGEAHASYIEIVLDDIPAAVAAIKDFDIEIVEDVQQTEDGARAVLRDLDGHVVTLLTPGGRFRTTPRETAA